MNLNKPAISEQEFFSVLYRDLFNADGFPESLSIMIMMEFEDGKTDWILRNNVFAYLTRAKNTIYRVIDNNPRFAIELKKELEKEFHIKSAHL